MNKVRTRFAPSPTGFMHVGGLRTALYSYAFAKSQSGQFILRIEDTDRKRFVPGAAEKICDLLKLFNLQWDEGPLIGGPYEPYIQSQRVATGIYQKYAEKLLKEDHSYCCFCPTEKEEDKNVEETSSKLNLRDKCRYLSEKEVEEKLKSGIKPAIRLKVPDKEIVSYEDFIIQKKIEWETKNVDDAMLLKSDGFPTYHLAVVVDDFLMQVSHIIRGHDWLPSTPIHLLLMDYLGFSRPSIGHLTDILDPEGGKLSKRKGSVSCEEFLAEGYLPEAILNFIMLLGWAPKDNRELFILKDFVENFPKGNFQVTNPVFNRKKLDWFNGVYIRQKTDEELLQLISKSTLGGKSFAPIDADENLIGATIPLIKERIAKLSDYSTLAGFFFREPEVDRSLFSQNAKEQLSEAKEQLAKVDEWNKDNLDKVLMNLIKDHNWSTGEFFMNFRVALTGSKFTPPITDSAVILGKEKTLRRLGIAWQLI